MGYDNLKLKNQLCFPLYACSKEVVRKYKKHLGKIGLTYTQYIAMMALWEKSPLSVTELGNCLYLDSGTVTPLLKRMEADGFIKRTRNDEDERTVMVDITQKGLDLREQAAQIPPKVGGCLNLSHDETITLYKLLYKVLNNLEMSEDE